MSNKMVTKNNVVVIAGRDGEETTAAIAEERGSQATA